MPNLTETYLRLGLPFQAGEYVSAESQHNRAMRELEFNLRKKQEEEHTRKVQEAEDQRKFLLAKNDFGDYFMGKLETMEPGAPPPNPAEFQNTWTAIAGRYGVSPREVPMTPEEMTVMAAAVDQKRKLAQAKAEAEAAKQRENDMRANEASWDDGMYKYSRVYNPETGQLEVHKAPRSIRGAGGGGTGGGRGGGRGGEDLLTKGQGLSAYQLYTKIEPNPVDYQTFMANQGEVTAKYPQVLYAEPYFKAQATRQRLIAKMDKMAQDAQQAIEQGDDPATVIPPEYMPLFDYTPEKKTGWFDLERDKPATIKPRKDWLKIAATDENLFPPDQVQAVRMVEEMNKPVPLGGGAGRAIVGEPSGPVRLGGGVMPDTTGPQPVRLGGGATPPDGKKWGEPTPNNVESWLDANPGWGSEVNEATDEEKAGFIKQFRDAGYSNAEIKQWWRAIGGK